MGFSGATAFFASLYMPLIAAIVATTIIVPTLIYFASPRLQAYVDTIGHSSILLFHANKNGVRYRYYVSHAILQKRNAQAGSVPQLPAPEIEALIINGLRDRLGLIAGDAGREPGDDRD